jgi:hypothetical protein
MTPPSTAAAAQPARRVAPPRPRRAPAGPRRISGPARPSTWRAPAEDTREGLVVGLLGAAETLSSSRLLDRLIGSRLWIGIVAFALIGIVTLQLGLLKLNSGIGRALERTATLQTANSALSIENSELASGTRVESQAERLGLRLSPVGNLHFLSSHASTDASRAADVLRKPLVPASEPPGGSVATTSESAEASATSTSGETSPSGETSTSGGAPSRETSTMSESTTPSTESSSTGTGTEAGAATAPTSETTPASTEAGGGTAGPTG